MPVCQPHIRTTPLSRRRGGTIFTMVLFIMMLISTGLMYYYFQRTKSLQRELVTLKSGNGVGLDTGESSFWEWLPWNREKDQAKEAPPLAAPTDADAVKETAVPAPGPEAEVAAPAEPAVNEAELPPSGAASTPRPMVQDAAAAAPAALDLTADPKPMEELTPLQVDETASTEEVEPGEESRDAPGESSSEEAGGEEPEPQEANEPIQSMYDQLPPVRVRSPRQNR